MSPRPQPSPVGDEPEAKPSFKSSGSHIRLVPYSPPRISSESSALSRPVSFAEGSSSPSLPGGGTPPPDGIFALDLHEFQDSDTYGTPTPQGSANWTVARASPPSSRPPSAQRPKRVISVHSDKTFSVLPQSYSPGSQTGSNAGSLSSHKRSSVAASTLVDRSLSLTSAASTFVDGQRSSLSNLAKTEVYSLRASQSRVSVDAAPSPSPWSYRFVGGLRKVERDSHNAGEAQAPPDVEPVGVAMLSQGSQPDTHNVTPRPLDPTHMLMARQSRTSLTSQSTLSEKSNYKTYAYKCRGAPDRRAETTARGDQDSPPSSSSHSNVEVLGESSPEQSVIGSTRPQSGRSEPNYEVYHSEPPSSPIASRGDPELHREYSQESLVVAPLRTQRYIPRASGGERQLSGRSSRDRRVDDEMVDNHQFNPPSTRPESKALPPDRPSRDGNLYSGITRRWSTALSTLMSEGDVESDHKATPPWQPGSQLEDNGHVSDADSYESPVDAGDATLPRPSQTHSGGWNRETTDPDLPLISDLDEHGDGLGDLQSLYRGTPRPWLHSMLANVPSDRNLRSAESSRSNSFSRSPIPAWARLYYGGGERRLLAAQKSSDSMFSTYAGQSNRGPLMTVPEHRVRPNSRTQDPDISQATPATRRREQTQDLLIERAPAYPPVAILRQIKKQTSSIWSPHLHRDKRTHKYSLWRPPHVERTGAKSSSRAITMQVVLFVAGFVFPFAWMVASILPLRTGSMHDGENQHGHIGGLNHEKGPDAPPQDDGPAIYFNHAQWWRSLNRGMAVLGLAIIGAAIALIVIGTRHQ